MSSGKIINIILILVITIMFLLSIRGSENNFKEIMSRWARSSGVNYLKENKIEGNGFHSDAQGDMIIWYNFPKTKARYCWQISNNITFGSMIDFTKHQYLQYIQFYWQPLSLECYQIEF